MNLPLLLLLWVPGAIIFADLMISTRIQGYGEQEVFTQTNTGIKTLCGAMAKRFYWYGMASDVVWRGVSVRTERLVGVLYQHSLIEANTWAVWTIKGGVY